MIPALAAVPRTEALQRLVSYFFFLPVADFFLAFLLATGFFLVAFLAEAFAFVILGEDFLEAVFLADLAFVLVNVAVVVFDFFAGFFTLDFLDAFTLLLVFSFFADLPNAVAQPLAYFSLAPTRKIVMIYS